LNTIVGILEKNQDGGVEIGNFSLRKLKTLSSGLKRTYSSSKNAVINFSAALSFDIFAL
jgi:hypothetical protein